MSPEKRINMIVGECNLFLSYFHTHACPLVAKVRRILDDLLAIKTYTGLKIPLKAIFDAQFQMKEILSGVVNKYAPSKSKLLRSMHEELLEKPLLDANEDEFFADYLKTIHFIFKNIKPFPTALNLELIHIAKPPLQGQGFFDARKKNPINKEFPTSFGKEWEKGLGRDPCDFAAAIRGVQSLFRSYSSPFYSPFTRHHHRLVTDIVKFTQKNPSLDALLQFLNGKRTAAYGLNINPQGHYLRMLDYAITNLDAFTQMTLLPGLDERLSARL